MIELSQINKRYADGPTAVPALDGVDLRIARGEFIAVMGPSGCGKTTLLNIIGLIDAPSSGRYVFADEDLSNRSIDELATLRKRHMAFIFQSFHLIADLTVYDNVELPLRYQNVARVRRRTLVREALELVGLDARARQFPEQLSGGQRQRVAIARAVVNDPEVILADEPTGNLDSRNGEEVLDMLVTLNRSGATVLMVTHSRTCARHADRIIHLVDGRVVPAALARA